MHKTFKDLTQEELKELSELYGRPYTEEDDRKYKEKYPDSIEDMIAKADPKKIEAQLEAYSKMYNRGIDDHTTMDPLDNVVSCFKTLIIQMQSINDHLSWISQRERLSHMTPEGFPIKCELCKEIYKHDIVD